jgi:MFS family permease
MTQKWLTKTVFIISLVSLLNDAASELLYPVLPIYLAGIGFGAMWIGVIEGIAEAAAGFSKGWFGKWSDMRGERLPFIRFGYLLSSLAKPLIVLFPNIFWAVFMRSTDRLGKGVRTGARDAMLSLNSPPEHRGKVFGFHRAMDTIGAFIGPSLALWWLMTHRGSNIKDIFYLALIPAALSMMVLFLLKETKIPPIGNGKPGIKNMFNYWNEGSKEFRNVITGLLLFGLCNSSDLFLLMALRSIHEHTGATYFGHHFTADESVIIYYIFYNFIYAAFAFPAGILSDKFSPKTTFIIGLFFYATTYAGFSWLTSNAGTDHQVFAVVLMILYGIFGAINDGVSKTWISLIVPKEEKGAALGFFAGGSSISLLMASLIGGVIWTFAGSWVMFAATSVLTLVAIFYLSVFTNRPQDNQ